MELERKLPFPVLLISDLDDTIKISHTQSKLITIYRGLFRSAAFAGMASLYQEILANHPGSTLAIVSSSPPAIRKKIEYFLRLNEFPGATLTLRDWIREPAVLAYKIKAISALTERSPHPVILVGDDTEHDPEVLAQVEKKFPGKVLARYIRVVKGRELPENTKGFFTAFDIACAELAAGRLKSDQVLRVGESVLKAEKLSGLIPWFSLQPPLHFVPFLISPDEAILELWGRIKSKLESLPKRKMKS
jgi:phosphatidate phosphatase APP1